MFAQVKTALTVALSVCLIGAFGTLSSASAQYSHKLKSSQAGKTRTNAELDKIFKSAKPMLRQAKKLRPKIANMLAAKSTAAGPRIMAPTSKSSAAGGMAPQNYGSGNQNTIFHYTDGLVVTNLVLNWYYRVTGHFLFLASDGGWYRCTASLIGKGIMLTAGHCIHDGGNGSSGWIQEGYFYPARYGDTYVFGSADAIELHTTSGWFNEGFIDEGYDVGLVVLGKRNGYNFPMGDYLGYYNFCYSNCLQDYWYLTQLGYPGNYYDGRYMTRGQHLETSDGWDFIYGSGMQGGSSGGPHISNHFFLSDSTSDLGQYTTRNVVFAVTSWGYVSDSIKIQGASSLSGPNNSNNFPAMFNAACATSRSLHSSENCGTLPTASSETAGVAVQ